MTGLPGPFGTTLLSNTIQEAADRLAPPIRPEKMKRPAFQDHRINVPSTVFHIPFHDNKTFLNYVTFVR